MKKLLLPLAFIAVLTSQPILSQNKPDYTSIDIKLVKGDYRKVIDTCNLILNTDSLNAEIYFKLGTAYQNLMSEDKALENFLRASAISPDNRNYQFMVAKSYFNKGKNDNARPILQKLYEADTTNWIYAYYLTSIYMQQGKYYESIGIYTSFYRQDTANTMLMDKLGFASLRNGEYANAIQYLERSLSINRKNTNSIKNLSYLYAATGRIDTATGLLTAGIAYEPRDMDLYARRAAIYFSTGNNKRSLNDYLKILSSGDSTTLYLKRAGIGYSNNLQPDESNKYLLLALKKDTSDYETLDYIAKNYHSLKDRKKCEYYYNKLINVLAPFTLKREFAYINLAEEFNSDGMYYEAIDNYLKGQRMGPDKNIDMIIGNIYDEKLDNKPKAIQYYQKFLSEAGPGGVNFTTEYIQSVRNRLDFLVEKQKEKHPAIKK